MARSLFDQDLQIRPSISYDDAVGSPNDATTAEGQTSLQGDLNVLRTLMGGLVGETNWYDSPDLSLQGVYDKQFIYLHADAGFSDVTVDTTTTTAFDTTIKAISGHADGAGSSTVSGVVVNSTRAYRLSVRLSSNQNPITDGAGNEVYGRLSHDGTDYSVTWYSNVSGTETVHAMTNDVVDLAYVAISNKFQELPWDRFLDMSFHDLAGIVGSITDDDVVVDGMTDLLNGLTTQAQVNAKLDDLGSTSNAQGASLVAIEDASAWFSGGDVEGALNNIEAAIGGTASGTINYTENNVLTDDLSVRANLEELDLKWGDLASTAASEGASLVSIYDADAYYTSTDVEGALKEVWEYVQDAEGIKAVETNGSPISSGVSHTLPGSLTYTPASGGLNMDVYLDGQLLFEGASNDYVEVAGVDSTTIQFNFTVPANRNLTYISRK